MGTVGNQDMVRITNQRLILNLIKEKKSISRAEIAKTLNLSPPSTSSNIAKLLETGLILERGEGKSIGGRRPILIELNRRYGYIMGIDMGCDEIKVTLGDIYAEIVDASELKVQHDCKGMEILIDIINIINTLAKKNGLEKDRIKIILISVPDVSGKSFGKLLIPSGVNEVEDIDISRALETEFKAKVILKNHASVAAFGEFRFGLKQKCRDMMFVNADTSIEAGLIINGELYEGSIGAAGIIGNTAFLKEQIGGIYKKNGYLETAVSTRKLVQRIKNMCKSDRTLLELCDGDIDRLDFGLIKRAYEKNHPIVKNELDRVVELIAIAIANINSILNLDTIVLGGKMAILGEYYILSIKRILGELCLFTPYIMYSTLKDNSAAYGTLALGQQYILNNL